MGQYGRRRASQQACGQRDLAQHLYMTCLVHLVASKKAWGKAKYLTAEIFYIVLLFIILPNGYLPARLVNTDSSYYPCCLTASSTKAYLTMCLVIACPTPYTLVMPSVISILCFM